MLHHLPKRQGFKTELGFKAAPTEAIIIAHCRTLHTFMAPLSETLKLKNREP